VPADHRTVRAHRWMFEFASGLRPARRPLLHTCAETGCVALDHLVVGTQAAADTGAVVAD